MGNTQPYQQLRVSQPLPPSWRKADFSEQLLQDSETGELAELHTVTLNYSLAAEMQRYDYRLAQDQNLVRVLHVSPNKERALCAVEETLTVVTEYIPYRLAEAHNIPLG